MGINNLLPRVLPSAGRENYDLRALSDGLISLTPSSSSSSSSHTTDQNHDDDEYESSHHRFADNTANKRRKRRRQQQQQQQQHWTRRKVRIAVDVNGWIARAAHGYGGSLMDSRHLSYHGRAELRHHEQLRQQQHQQQQQQQQQPQPAVEEGEQNSDNPTITTAASANVNDETNQRKQQQQQRLEYISSVISFVLERIEFLRGEECQALVLPVLDGATPPCKRGACRERNERRGRATAQRDEVVGAVKQQQQRRLSRSMPRSSSAAAASTTTINNNNNNSNNTSNNTENEEEEGVEATRTEAEVLRRISASKRAGTGTDQSLRREILGELLAEFRRRRWPFLVAPYEADGQLAYLASGGSGRNGRAVDLVVTEDSDLIGLGVPTLIYRLGGWNGSNAANRGGSAADAAVRGGGGGGGAAFFGTGGRSKTSSSGNALRGTMLHRRDLGSSHGIDLLDFSDAMLATMFVTAGCDYCDSLKGIGVVTARNIVKRAFHGTEADDCEGGYSTASDILPVLRVVLNRIFQSCHKDAREQVLPIDDPDKEEVRAAYERSFLGAIAMFRHPLVYDPILGVHVVANDVCEDCDVVTPASRSFLTDERILMEYQPYRDLVTKRELLYEVVGAPFDPETAKGIAEGLIDPRQLPVPEPTQSNTSRSAPHRENEHAATQEDECLRDEVGEHVSRDLTQGGSSNGMQLSSQDFSRAGTQQSNFSGAVTQQSNFSGVGTQQSKSGSAASGMISSLSPDLLASPSPQKHS